ncbi:MAG: Na+/H+ antiporter subunit E [Deltaproteobacteria bacterium]|nr:Na+/H+ antiporter subunit E [Deltaproteobacteria bacterium]
MNGTFLRNTILQAVLLMVFWLIMSGHYDLMHVSFGIFSVILVLLIHRPIRKHLFALGEHSAALKLNLVRLAYYIPWLLWQIVIASLQVAYAVLHPKCPIDPAVVRFKTRLGNTSSKVILGNSITLTPGTITLEIEREQFLVHSLMDVSSSGIIDGTLPGEVAKLYERSPGQVVRDVRVIKTEAGFDA